MGDFIKEKDAILRIVIKEINTDIPFSENSHLLPSVSPERQERISRVHNNRIKNVQLFSEITMISEAARDLCVPEGDIRVKKTDLGKPYIEGFENYHISISHCDGMIMFASDSSPVGVDIEKSRKDYERLSKRFFTSEEYEKIVSSEKPEEEFLLVWTRKEAYLKLIGTGLGGTSLDSFNVYDQSIFEYETNSIVSGLNGISYIYSTVTGRH